MATKELDTKSISDFDDSTTCTALTPPTNVATSPFEDVEPLENHSEPSSTSSVPWPDSTYIIRSVSTGDVITLFDGQIILGRPGGHGSIHWWCCETEGWLGFKNPTSGKFLGHDQQGVLSCWAQKHRSWESFCVRMSPAGGYVLMMRHYDKLWYVGQQGAKLAKIGDGRDHGLVWEFIKV